MMGILRKLTTRVVSRLMKPLESVKNMAMSAIRIHKFGGVDQLHLDDDVPMPECAANEVIIASHAVAVSPTDILARMGRLEDFLHEHLPIIPGWDVSGVVETVGSDVTAFRKGDEVFCRPWTGRAGTFADFVAVPAEHVAFKPKNITHELAAAVPLSCQTAWGVLFETAKLQPGQRVVVHAAAGGVGVFAVQLAKLHGAYVIGTASSNNQDFVREIGADEVLDYRKYDSAPQPKDIDLVFDTVGASVHELSMSWLKPGGMLVSIVNLEPSQELARKHKVTACHALPKPSGVRLTAIKDLIEQDKLKIVVQEILTRDQVKRAHELVQSGHVRGKIVVKWR